MRNLNDDPEAEAAAEAEEFTIAACAISADSELAACTSKYGDTDLEGWNVTTEKFIYTCNFGNKYVTTVAFSPCDTLLLAGDADGGVHLLNARTGQRLRESKKLQQAVYGCVFSPDSSRVVTLHYTSSSQDGGVGARAVLWDIRAVRDAVAPRPRVAAQPSSELRDNLLALLRSGEDADVVLRCTDGTEFKAHRLILRMRSSTLAANLSGRHGAVDVATVREGMPAAVFSRVLEFIYADELKPKGAVEAAVLLDAADFYGVLRLRSICEAVLAAELTPDNVVSMLLLADKHSAQGLRDAALRYIAARGPAVAAAGGVHDLVAAQAPQQLLGDVLHTVMTGVPPPRRPAIAAAAPAALPAPPAAGAGDAAAAGEGRRTRQRRE